MLTIELNEAELELVLGLLIRALAKRRRLISLEIARLEAQGPVTDLQLIRN